MKSKTQTASLMHHYSRLGCGAHVPTPCPPPPQPSPPQKKEKQHCDIVIQAWRVCTILACFHPNYFLLLFHRPKTINSMLDTDILLHACCTSFCLPSHGSLCLETRTSACLWLRFKSEMDDGFLARHEIMALYPVTSCPVYIQQDCGC